jgi:hypothetical protein
MITKDIAHNIKLAYDLFEALDTQFQNDEKFRALLQKLDESIDTTHHYKDMYGISDECADCSLHGNDTCCGKRTGFQCDPIILFLNIKLGYSLKVQDTSPHLCSFLSVNGCTLRVRPILCVNFLCKRLRDNIPHQNLVQLQTVAGEELDTLFLIENTIKRKSLTLPDIVKNSVKR